MDPLPIKYVVVIMKICIQYYVSYMEMCIYVLIVDSISRNTKPFRDGRNTIMWLHI